MASAPPSLVTRLTSKEWKVRLEAYTELADLLAEYKDPSSPEFAKYGAHFKKIVADNYPPVKEKGLDALLIFLDRVGSLNAALVTDLVNLIVNQCFSGRDSIKAKAVDALLLMIEINSMDPVISELCRTCIANKLPKISVGCVYTLREAVRQFGIPPLPPQHFLEVLEPCMEHSFKDVRTEAFSLAIELHRWIGPSLKQAIASLRPSLLRELEVAFENSEPVKEAQALRFMRPLARVASSSTPSSSNQPSNPITPSKKPLQVREQPSPVRNRPSSPGPRSQNAPSGANSNKVKERPPAPSKNPSTPTVIPSSSQTTLVDILPLFTAEWYKNLDSSDWATRKEQLDVILEACGISTGTTTPPANTKNITPVFPQGDYVRFVIALTRVLTTETNMWVITGVVKVIGILAVGMQPADFSAHFRRFLPVLLERFKEKKPAVSEGIHFIIDVCITKNVCGFGEIIEPIIIALSSKVPKVRLECIMCIERVIKMIPQSTVVDVYQPICEALVRLLDDSGEDIRDAAFSAMAILIVIVGDDLVRPYVEKLDRVKSGKLKEYMSNLPPEITNLESARAEVRAPEVRPSSPNREKPKISRSGNNVITNPNVLKRENSSNLNSNNNNNNNKVSPPTTPPPIPVTPTHRPTSAITSSHFESIPVSHRPNTASTYHDNERFLNRKSGSPSPERAVESPSMFLSTSSPTLDVKMDISTIKGEIDNFTAQMVEQLARLETKIRLKDDRRRQEAEVASQYDKEMLAWNETLMEKVDTLERELEDERNKNSILEDKIAALEAKIMSLERR
eukprot:TRINITY_DN587_c0_g3_i2.p1 TRINITY_DN587_c0_g3~~TRINITY_DN587_c0_g3_i2.p1  ORF type:complete len:794 (-),score=196.54 TRINITY_DN587_c0_g3_i2:40-2421(-)